MSVYGQIALEVLRILRIKAENAEESRIIYLEKFISDADQELADAHSGHSAPNTTAVQLLVRRRQRAEEQLKRLLAEKGNYTKRNGLLGRGK